MYFRHSSEIWRDHPALVPGVIFAAAIKKDASVDAQIAKYSAIAESRLVRTSEGEFPEIQAWRRAFSKMGLKPTQYRCASEALLRRFRKETALPRIHPLIDLCNAISLPFAIPVAVFDVAKIANGLTVRHATGLEAYLAFSGDEERPDPGEVVFADEAGRAHARRWTNRQSAFSAVGDETAAVLIVAEAMHESAEADIGKLAAALTAELHAIWSSPARSATPTSAQPQFDF